MMRLFPLALAVLTGSVQADDVSFKTDYVGTSTGMLYRIVSGSSRVSVSNGFGPEAGVAFDATGLATGTPLYVGTDLTNGVSQGQTANPNSSSTAVELVKVLKSHLSGPTKVESLRYELHDAVTHHSQL